MTPTLAFRDGRAHNLRSTIAPVALAAALCFRAAAAQTGAAVTWPAAPGGDAPSERAGAAPWPSGRGGIAVPHLTGIFVSLDNVTAVRSVEGWVDDLTAMKAIGIEWFCVRAVLAGASHPPQSLQCPLGGFASYFPGAPKSECVHPAAGNGSVDTVGNVLEAAKRVGLQVHFGLAFPSASRVPDFLNSTEYYRVFAGFCWDVAEELWGRYGEQYGSIITGWYTGIEESNSLGWLDLMKDLADHYLEPLARDLRNMTHPARTTVWASPYYVGNLTRDPQTAFMTPRFYGDWWEEMFHVVPDLDFIAPQDSMGAQGNSFENVTTFLTELAGASARADRRILSNVELFEVWPPDCPWTPSKGACHGRHPAPFSRIKAQMANEAPIASELIAWEWHTCLSPFGKDNTTMVNYETYKKYIQGGSEA